MLADVLDIEESDVLRAVNEYTEALLLLDQYDHHTLCKSDGSSPIYRITYEECVQMVGNPCRVIRKITEKDHMPDGIEKFVEMTRGSF